MCVPISLWESIARLSDGFRIFKGSGWAQNIYMYESLVTRVQHVQGPQTGA